MSPETQKKREFCAFVDEIDFLVSFLLIRDAARPVLFEEDKIQFQRNQVAGMATVEAHQFYRGKRGAEFFEQRFVEAVPHLAEWG